MALRPGQGLAPWELATAKKIVDEFRRRSRLLERFDFDDLVQDCLLHWIGIRKKVDADSTRPPVAFMAQVLRNMLADWVRRLDADKRAGELEWISLDATLDGSDDGMTLAESLEGSDFARNQDSAEEAMQARMDILRMVPELTPLQQRLCWLLGEEGLSVKAAAERMGMPRATLYVEIHRIRALCTYHGLEIYLKG